MRNRFVIALIVLLLFIGGAASVSRVRGAPHALARGAAASGASATGALTVAHGMPATATGTPRSRPTSTPRTIATAIPTRTATRRSGHARTATRRSSHTRRSITTPTPSRTPTPLVPSSGPVQLGDAQFSLFTINPQFTRQQVSVTLSAPARVWVRIAPIGAVTHVRTMDLGVQPAGTVTLEWDGRDNAHRLVPAGDYSYTITATNARGVVRTDTNAGLGVTYKRIRISLSKQQLWAFDGDHYMMSSLVTTGNPALPTPLGHYPILGRYSPFTFVSPFPYGSKFYYTPSPTNDALLFDNRGYYVHDAPWRSNFGPGSNATTGTPGQTYTGTHGCVNVPLTMMQPLFVWATIGTVVEVVR